MNISQQTPTTDRTYTTTTVNEYASTSNPAETFSHDHDGNLTSDATLDYAWDAGTLDISGLATRAVADACPPEKSRENRLIGVTPKSPSYGDYKYAYEYDYMGRVGPN